MNRRELLKAAVAVPVAVSGLAAITEAVARPGVWMGVDGSFRIGDTASFIYWDGHTLHIEGITHDDFYVDPKID